MSDQQMANRLYSILKEKAAMGMGVVAGARKKSRSKTAKRSKSCPVRRRCPKGSRKTCKAGEMEDLMDIFGDGRIKGVKTGPSAASKKAAKNNPWIKHVKAFVAIHNKSHASKISYADVLQDKNLLKRARQEYCVIENFKPKSCKSGSKTAKKKVTFKKKAVSKSKTAKKKCPKGQKAKKIQGYKRKSGKRIKPYRRCVKAGELLDEMLYY